MLISFEEAGRMVDLSRSQVERLVKAGAFPRPVQVTLRRFAFVRSEVEAWAAERIRVRDERREADDPVIAATRARSAPRLPVAA
jgi:prophage regulatory protein